MSTLTDDDLTRLLDEAASSYDVPEHGADEILGALESPPAKRSVLRRRWVPLSSAAALVLVGGIFAAGQYGGSSSTPMSAAVKADRSLTYGKYAPDAGAAAAPGTPIDKSLQTEAGRLPLTKAASGVGSSAAGGVAPDRLAAPVPVAAAPLLAGADGTAQHNFAGSAPGAVAPPVSAPATDEGDSRVVKSGSIALIVKDKQVSTTLTAVQRAAKAQGGYIAASSSDEYGDTPSGEVSIRVPVARFENLVAAVRGLDAKVRTASTSGKDVTAQYSDLESQLRTLKATRERFLVILSQTKTIGEILTVQQRVDTVTGQIDRIEGQRKLLASQSDLSTLTVSVSEAGDPIVKATSKPRSGLSQAFVDAKNGFVSGVESIVRNSGGFLLFFICLGVVLLVGRLGWRVARRRMV